MTKKEKSVGAIIYYIDENDQYQFLVQQHVNGKHWAYAKGHVEGDENEEETALREIEEETAITAIQLDTNFRESTCYMPTEDTEKEVVYFLAKTNEQAAKARKRQTIEVIDIVFLPYDQAVERVSYPNDKTILKKAYHYLMQA